MPGYIGDFTSISTITHPWDSIDSSGGSITPSTITPGTIQVFKDNNTIAITSGITDSRAFGAIAGYHMVTINLSGATYSTGSNYHVMLLGSSIASQVVNAALFSFSIKNRFPNNTSVEASLTSVLNEISAIIVDTSSIKVSVSSILADTTVILQDTSALKVDSTAIKLSLSTLLTDTSSLKVSASSILNETSAILADTSSLKVDSTAIKLSLSTLLADTSALKVSVSSVLNETTAILQDTSALKVDSTAIKLSLSTLLADTSSLKVSASSILSETTAIITAISGIPSTVLGVINDQVIDSTITDLERRRIELAVLVGQSSGAGTSSIKYFAGGTSAPGVARVSANLSTLGERTGIVLNGAAT